MMSTNPSTKKTLLARSLAISGGLTTFKIAVFFATNSTAILASAADSFMDFLVSLANFWLVRSASKPADHDHPYGHGKIESLSGMVQSLIIGGVTIGIAVMAVKRFINPEPLTEPLAGMAITFVALGLNLWHTKNLKASMLKTKSQVMAAEYLHYATDTLVYVGVLVALGLFKLTGYTFWDPLITIAIVAYLLKSVATIFHDTLSELLDSQLPEANLREIDQVIRGYSAAVVDYHDLRTRKVGPTKFIEFHVVLKGIEGFREAHDMAEGMTSALQLKFPGAVVIVHADPEGAD